MVSFKSIGAKISGRVRVLYPVHGVKNILRVVEGVVVSRGVGPNGKYIVVQADNGSYRSLSLKKIVNMQ